MKSYVLGKIKIHKVRKEFQLTKYDLFVLIKYVKFNELFNIINNDILTFVKDESREVTGNQIIFFSDDVKEYIKDAFNNLSELFKNTAMLELCYDYDINVLTDLSGKLKEIYKMESEKVRNKTEFIQKPEDMAMEIVVHMDFLIVGHSKDILDNMLGIKEIKNYFKERATVADIGANFKLDNNNKFTHIIYKTMKSHMFFRLSQESLPFRLQCSRCCQGQCSYCLSCWPLSRLRLFLSQ